MSCCGVTTRRTRLPLSPHCNPPKAPSEMDSLGDFHCSHAVSYPLLQIWFQGNSTSSLAGDLLHQLPYPPYPRKAGYSAHSVHGSAGSHRIAGLHPESYAGRKYHRGSTPAHINRSPQMEGRLPHAIEDRPTSASGEDNSPLSTQHPPQTGRKKQAPWVSQLCPLKDF